MTVVTGLDVDQVVTVPARLQVVVRVVVRVVVFRYYVPGVRIVAHATMLRVRLA